MVIVFFELNFNYTKPNKDFDSRSKIQVTKQHSYCNPHRILQASKALHPPMKTKHSPQICRLATPILLSRLHEFFLPFIQLCFQHLSPSAVQLLHLSYFPQCTFVDLPLALIALLPVIILPQSSSWHVIERVTQTLQILDFLTCQTLRHLRALLGHSKSTLSNKS